MPQELWQHLCEEEGSIAVGVGEACSWCGGVQKQEPAPTDLTAEESL